MLSFSVTCDWRLNDKVVSLAARLPKVGQPYKPPHVHAQRKAVVCPAASTLQQKTSQNDAWRPP